MIVLAGGGHAKVVISLLHKLAHDVRGYVDVVDRGEVQGVSWLGTDDDLPDLRTRFPHAALALGLGKPNVASARRGEAIRDGRRAGFEFPPIVSPSACVDPSAHLGAASVVGDGAVVGPDVQVGEACIINTNSTVDHDCVLGDDVHISPGVTVSGGVTVQDGAMLGAGATVVPGARVGAGVLVGAGAVVTRDLLQPGTYVGVPARPLRQEHER